MIRLRDLISWASALSWRARTRLPRRLRGRGGQIAAMFLVFIVVMIILAFATANMGKISLTATATANAADASALGLASNLATKSNQLFKSLGNSTSKCKKGGLLPIILAVIVAIIVIIIIIISCFEGCWGIGLAPLVLGGGLLGGAVGGAIGGAITYGSASGALTGALQGAAIGLAIGAAVAGPYAAPAGMGLVGGGAGAATLTAAGIAAASIAATLVVGSAIYNAYVQEQIAGDVVDALAKSLEGLPERESIEQGTMLDAFLRTVDDPQKETDSGDVDRDGDTGEKVNRFILAWDAHVNDVKAKFAITEQMMTRIKQFLDETTGAVQTFTQKALAFGMGQLARSDSDVYEAGVEPFDGELIDLVRILKLPEVRQGDRFVPYGSENFDAYEVPFWEPGPPSDQLWPWLCPECVYDPDFPVGSNPDTTQPSPPLGGGYDQLDWMALELDQFFKMTQDLSGWKWLNWSEDPATTGAPLLRPVPEDTPLEPLDPLKAFVDQEKRFETRQEWIEWFYDNPTDEDGDDPTDFYGTLNTLINGGVDAQGNPYDGMVSWQDTLKGIRDQLPDCHITYDGSLHFNNAPCHVYEPRRDELNQIIEALNGFVEWISDDTLQRQLLYDRIFPVLEENIRNSLAGIEYQDLNIELNIDDWTVDGITLLGNPHYGDGIIHFTYIVTYTYSYTYTRIDRETIPGDCYCWFRSTSTWPCYTDSSCAVAPADCPVGDPPGCRLNPDQEIVTLTPVSVPPVTLTEEIPGEYGPVFSVNIRFVMEGGEGGDLGWFTAGIEQLSAFVGYVEATSTTDEGLRFGSSDPDTDEEFIPVFGAMDTFVEAMQTMQGEILLFWNDMQAYEAALAAALAAGPTNIWTYPWNDSRGSHSVTVEIGPFQVARTKKTKSGNFLVNKKCIKMVDFEDPTGENTWVHVIRQDPSRGTPLGTWNPFSGTTDKMARSAYSVGYVKHAGAQLP